MNHEQLIQIQFEAIEELLEKKYINKINKAFFKNSNVVEEPSKDLAYIVDSVYNEFVLFEYKFDNEYTFIEKYLSNASKELKNKYAVLLEFSKTIVFGAFEVSYKNSKAVTMKDIFTNEEYTVYDKHYPEEIEVKEKAITITRIAEIENKYKIVNLILLLIYGNITIIKKAKSTFLFTQVLNFQTL